MKKAFLWFLIIAILIGLFIDDYKPRQTSHKRSYPKDFKVQETQKTESEPEKTETEVNSTESSDKTVSGVPMPDDLSEKIPYAGMPEEWINDTIMGPYDKTMSWSGGRTGMYGQQYTWILGNYRVLDVYTYRKTGRVVQIKYYNEEFAWYPTGEEFLYKYDLENGYQWGPLLMPKFKDCYDGELITGDDMNKYIDDMYKKAQEMYDAEHREEEEEEKPEYTDFWDWYDDYGDYYDSIDEAWDDYDSEYER